MLAGNAASTRPRENGPGRQRELVALDPGRPPAGVYPRGGDVPESGREECQASVATLGFVLVFILEVSGALGQMTGHVSARRQSLGVKLSVRVSPENRAASER